MAANNFRDGNELEKRLETFQRQARFEDQLYRFMGRPQISDRRLSVLLAYPADGCDKTAFMDVTIKALYEYGLDVTEAIQNKRGIRVQVRLRSIDADSINTEEVAPSL